MSEHSRSGIPREKIAVNPAADTTAWRLRVQSTNQVTFGE